MTNNTFKNYMRWRNIGEFSISWGGGSGIYSRGFHRSLWLRYSSAFLSEINANQSVVSEALETSAGHIMLANAMVEPGL